MTRDASSSDGDSDRDPPDPSIREKDSDWADVTRGGTADEDLPVEPPSSGQPPVRQSSLERADLALIVLSVLIPGIGHVFKGLAKRGFLIMGAALLTCCTLGVVNIGAALDLYCVVMTRPYRMVGEWDLFPDADTHLQG